MIRFDAYLPPRSAARSARRGEAADALRDIPDGARVVIAPLSGTPFGLLEELDRLRERWTQIELAGGPGGGAPR